MATTIAGGLHKAEDLVRNASSRDKKLVDLERNTDNIHTKLPLKSDHGVSISNTDNWLKAADYQHTGPSLLEDQFAREKARILVYS